MARLLAFIGNRPDLGTKAVHVEEAALTVHARPGVQYGWGVGFYQGGEVLLRRRPLDDRATLTLSDITAGAVADVLLSHVRAATVGTLRSENTHPFRYRQWLFACTGTLDQFDRLKGRLSDAIPGFLTKNIRGETDSELIFHLFLSFLHDAGELDRASAPPDVVVNALRSTLSLIDGLAAEEGASPAALNIILASPDFVVGIHRSPETMAFHVVEGQREFERLIGQGGLGRMRLPGLSNCRLALLASDFDEPPPPHWTHVPASSVITLTRLAPPEIQALA